MEIQSHPGINRGYNDATWRKIACSLFGTRLISLRTLLGEFAPPLGAHVERPNKDGSSGPICILYSWCNTIQWKLKKRRGLPSVSIKKCMVYSRPAGFTNKLNCLDNPFKEYGRGDWRTESVFTTENLILECEGSQWVSSFTKPGMDESIIDDFPRKVSVSSLVSWPVITKQKVNGQTVREDSISWPTATGRQVGDQGKSPAIIILLITERLPVSHNNCAPTANGGGERELPLPWRYGNLINWLIDLVGQWPGMLLK